MAASSSSDRRSLALSPADLAGRPLVFRDATVLTMDDSHRVIRGADVLIAGARISAVGPGLDVPEGTAEIDAAGGDPIPGGGGTPPPRGHTGPGGPGDRRGRSPISSGKYR